MHNKRNIIEKAFEQFVNETDDTLVYFLCSKNIPIKDAWAYVILMPIAYSRVLLKRAYFDLEFSMEYFVDGKDNECKLEENEIYKWCIKLAEERIGNQNEDSYLSVAIRSPEFVNFHKAEKLGKTIAKIKTIITLPY